MGRVLAAVGLVVLVVSAGCSSPLGGVGGPAADPDVDRDLLEDAAGPGTASPLEPGGARTESRGDSPDSDTRDRETGSVPPWKADLRSGPIPVRNGDLPVDAALTYGRVQRLLGVEAETPTIEIYPDYSGSDTFAEVGGDEFRRLIGLGRPTPEAAAEGRLEVGGATLPDGRVFIVPGEGGPAEIERTLAHEFVHVVQFDRGVRWDLRENVGDRHRTSGSEQVVRAVLEGAAVYVTDHYVREFQPSYTTQSAVLDDLYPNASAESRLFWAPYYFGSRYVASRVDSPGDLETVYDRPPRTTEQLLHRTRDPPAPLSVRVRPGETVWRERRGSRDSRGELFLRVALSSHLPRERAAAAAAGWGNDRLVTFARPAQQGYAWALRWDDPANATAFGDAMTAFLDARAERIGGRWGSGEETFALKRVTDRTVVLLAGNEDFVRGVSVSGSGERVTVSLPDDPNPGDDG